MRRGGRQYISARKRRLLGAGAGKQGTVPLSARVAKVNMRRAQVLAAGSSEVEAGDTCLLSCGIRLNGTALRAQAAKLGRLTR